MDESDSGSSPQPAPNTVTEALQLLRTGALESFLRGMGRSDLAIAAREAAYFPDANRRLDQLLGQFPTSRASAARLSVTPSEIDLGTLRLGQDQRLMLNLVNEGKGLLHGVVASDVMVPKFVEVRLLLGAPKFVVFSTLKASTRTSSRDCPTPRPKPLCSPRSSV